MKEMSLKRQAAVTAAGSAAVRALGFVLRLWISRSLGAEAVGIMELAAGAHALSVTPGAAGLPGAVSRLTAKAETEGEKHRVLQAGKSMALRTGLLLCPLFLLLSPWIARWLGDARTLPSLWFYAPCVLLIALSSVYDGYCFGQGKPLPPALSECAEQLIRLGIVLGLSFLLPRITPAWRAALPAFAALAGEAVGFGVVKRLSKTGKTSKREKPDPAVKRQLRRLAFPLLINRLTHTWLHTLSGVIIPLRLSDAGLDHREALSRLGMLNGMVMPLMFLPGLFAGALSAVGGPAAARCRTRQAENRLARRMLLSALGIGAACAAGLYLAAPALSMGLYRLPELPGLIRACCPFAEVMPVQQAAGGLMTGLGLQKKALAASLLGAAATLLCTWQWTPSLGIYGAAYASLLGHGLSLLCCLISLILRARSPRPDRGLVQKERSVV